MTNREFIEYLSERLTTIYDLKESRAISIRTLQHFSKRPYYDYIINPEVEISSDILKTLMEASERLLSAMPLQYVLGYQTFCDMDFFISEGVLIPRPETEELVKLIVLDNCSRTDLRILDIGCGSGCIAISLQQLFSSLSINTEVFACDMSDSALSITKKNSERLLTDGSISVFKWDILSSSPEIIESQSLDIVVSNPPYVLERERESISDNILLHEPHMALFVPDDNPLLFYKAIISAANSLLKPHGLIYFEINDSFGEEISELSSQLGYHNVKIIKDINDKERFVRLSK